MAVFERKYPRTVFSTTSVCLRHHAFVHCFFAFAWNSGQICIRNQGKILLSFFLLFLGMLDIWQPRSFLFYLSYPSCSFCHVPRIKSLLYLTVTVTVSKPLVIGIFFKALVYNHPPYLLSFDIFPTFRESTPMNDQFTPTSYLQYTGTNVSDG